MPIANHCLQYQERNRPSSEELCQRLADLKESTEYRECVHNNDDQIQAKDNQIMIQAQELEEKDRLLLQRADVINHITEPRAATTGN